MFTQSLHRNREAILLVLSIHTDITRILNSVLKNVEIQSKREKNSELSHKYKELKR